MNMYSMEKRKVAEALQCADAKQFEKAERIYHHLIADLETTLGPYHPSVAWKKAILAMIYNDSGDLDRARYYYHQAKPVLDQYVNAGSTQLWSNLKRIFDDLDSLDENSKRD